MGNPNLIKQYVKDDSVVIFKFVLFAAFLFYVMKLWLTSKASWLHPELLGTAAYVWAMPDVETLPNLLRKIFDWKAFDPNVNRVRPLNDVAEVLDAIFRPYLAKVIGPHPSISLSSIATVVLAPTVLYMYFKYYFKRSWIPLILCTIFITSTGFLSLVVGYIRPAKKLNLILMCVAIYLGHQYSTHKENKDFGLLCTTLMMSFFSDELGLINYAICGLMYWSPILNARKKLLIYASLPFLFLIIIKWGLPYIYRHFSLHGEWNALNDSKKFLVFEYLFNWKFYYATLVLTARSFLSTFGIYKHVFWTECSALLILLTMPFFQALRYENKKLENLARDPFIIISFLIFLVNIYDNLLDWYPFPYEISYLGSFNYYYHSNIVVLNIIWFALFLKNAIDFLNEKFLNVSFFSVLLIVIGSLMVTGNIVLFDKVNKLVQAIHLYPFSQKELQFKLNELANNIPSPNLVHINFTTSQDAIKKDFEKTLKFIFNDRWMENGFYRTFNLIDKNPIMGNAYLYHLTRAYYPHAKVVLQVNHQQI